MRKRKNSELTPFQIWFLIIVGGGTFLLMVFPFIFWFVAVPITILIIRRFIRWLKK